MSSEGKIETSVTEDVSVRRGENILKILYLCFRVYVFETFGYVHYFSGIC